MGEAEERCESFAREQHGVITRVQALACGLSRAGIDRKAASGAWCVAHPGVYVVARMRVGWLTDASVAVHRVAGAAAGPTGAAAWELDGFDEYRGPLQVITARDRRSEEDGLKVLRSSWLENARQLTTRRNNLRVLQPGPLLVTLGEFATIDEVEGAMDHVLRRKWATWEELERLAREARYTFKRGAATLAEAVARRSPQRQHTDSLLETKGLQTLRNHGLPTPVLQHPVYDGSDRVATADLAYPERQLLIETVGVKAHRSEVDQYTRDCRRLNRVNVLRHYTVLHYTWEQVTKAPEDLVNDVKRALGIARQTGLVVQVRPGGRPLLATPPR